MELDWTTLALEIVNFLILLWILKRFFFRPVRDAIARRRAAVAATIAQAQAQMTEAQTLQQQYENRMHDWDRERETARAQLTDDLAQERRRRLAELQSALDAEREKDLALQERRHQEQCRALEAKAADSAAGFAASILERLSGPELDARIAEVVIEDLAALPGPQRAALTAAARTGAKLEICSAHALPQTSLARLQAALQTQLGGPVEAVLKVDPQLGGGIRVALGPWVLEATLAHELAFFRQGLAHDG